MHRVRIKRIDKSCIINPILRAYAGPVPKTRWIKSVFTRIHKNNVIAKTFKNCPLVLWNLQYNNKRNRENRIPTNLQRIKKILNCKQY